MRFGLFDLKFFRPPTSFEQFTDVGKVDKGMAAALSYFGHFTYTQI